MGGGFTFEVQQIVKEDLSGSDDLFQKLAGGGGRDGERNTASFDSDRHPLYQGTINTPNNPCDTQP
jgi:hypothetical protein